MKKSSCLLLMLLVFSFFTLGCDMLLGGLLPSEDEIEPTVSRCGENTYGSLRFTFDDGEPRIFCAETKGMYRYMFPELGEEGDMNDEFGPAFLHTYIYVNPRDENEVLTLTKAWDEYMELENALTMLYRVGNTWDDLYIARGGTKVITEYDNGVVKGTISCQISEENGYLTDLAGTIVSGEFDIEIEEVSEVEMFIGIFYASGVGLSRSAIKELIGY